MYLKRIKNRIFRAATFCVLSSIFIINIFAFKNVIGVLGVTFFTISFFILFRDEKLIDLAHSKKYRFSFVRQIFYFENLMYSLAPKSLRNYSTHLSIILIVLIFSFVISDLILLPICIVILLILSLIYR